MGIKHPSKYEFPGAILFQITQYLFKYFLNVSWVFGSEGCELSYWGYALLESLISWVAGEITKSKKNH